MKENHMRNGSDVLHGCSTMDAWVATRRWTLTPSGNKRRVVDTPGHTFLVVEKPEKVLALYKSYEDDNWITIAVTRTLAEAKAALFACAGEAQVVWR
jgi:hypothetical protein